MTKDELYKYFTDKYTPVKQDDNTWIIEYSIPMFVPHDDGSWYSFVGYESHSIARVNNKLFAYLYTFWLQITKGWRNK